MGFAFSKGFQHKNFHSYYCTMFMKKYGFLLFLSAKIDPS